MQAIHFKLNQGIGDINITNSHFLNSDIKGGIGEIDVIFYFK